MNHFQPSIPTCVARWKKQLVDPFHLPRRQRLCHSQFGRSTWGKNLLVLSEGKTGAYGSKENIFERPCTLSVAQLTGCKTSPAQGSLIRLGGSY